MATAYEVQISDITDDLMERRSSDHRSDGIPTTLWLEAADAPPQRPGSVASLGLTRRDQVVGIAVKADVNWAARDWAAEMDIDRFCAGHRRSRFVWQSDYGVLTVEAWKAHLESGGVERDRQRRVKQRGSHDLDLHRSVHPDHGPLTLDDHEVTATNHEPRTTCAVCSENLPSITEGVHMVLAHGLPSTWR